MFKKRNYLVIQSLNSNGLITKYILKARSKRAIKHYYKTDSKKHCKLISIESTHKRGITELYKKPFKQFKVVMH